MDALRDTTDVRDLTKHIVIKLGNERYRIPIRYIDNIVKMQKVTRVPKAEPYLKGVINIRGDIVPVMSLRIKIEMGEDEVTEDTCILILRPESGNELFGIIVEAVDRVLTLGTNNIEKLTGGKARKDANFISGVGKYEDGLVSILDIEALEMDNEKKEKKE